MRWSVVYGKCVQSLRVNFIMKTYKPNTAIQQSLNDTMLQPKHTLERDLLHLMYYIWADTNLAVILAAKASACRSMSTQCTCPKHLPMY